MNLYIPYNRQMPLQVEEALGPISIPRGSHRVDPFQRNSASRAEKPGAYSTPGTPSGRGAPSGKRVVNKYGSVCYYYRFFFHETLHM